MQEEEKDNMLPEPELQNLNSTKQTLMELHHLQTTVNIWTVSTVGNLGGGPHDKNPGTP